MHYSEKTLLNLYVDENNPHECEINFTGGLVVTSDRYIFPENTSILCKKKLDVFVEETTQRLIEIIDIEEKKTLFIDPVYQLLAEGDNDFEKKKNKWIESAENQFNIEEMHSQIPE